MKSLFLVFVTVLSVVYVIPTLTGLDLEKTKFPFKQKINLGLDLQGGLYMVLGVDFQKVYRDVVERQATQVTERLKEKSIAGVSAELKREGADNDDPRILVKFPAENRNKVVDQIKTDFYMLRLAAETPTQLEFGLTSEYKAEVKDKTINQSIQVVRNRIDEFGVAEPMIASQGSDRIVVELPGVKEIERAKELIGRTAKLEFKMVDDKGMDPSRLAQLIDEAQKQHGIVFKDGTRFSDYVRALNDKVHGKIPANTEIAFERPFPMPGQPPESVQPIPYLLFSKVEVTGADLSDANVAFDPETRRPNVSFSLNPRGADLFDKLTAANIGNRLAIVLDGIVHSAPVIQSRIGGGNGQITMGGTGGDRVMKEAQDLAIVLRAGALPAQLDFLEQRVIGPSLGQDSIKQGTIAAIIGSLAIFFFITFYYRVSGLIATFSLLLNVLFVLAILVGLGATLTLPGIAGIALTVGIAVDSNVVIFERIREELRAGKRPQGAIEAGFQKAFRTILDANVTNAAAAIVLLIYGTGPIKGFAVTMLIGIVTTMFTAVFVCKLIYDVYLRRIELGRSTALSI